MEELNSVCQVQYECTLRVEHAETPFSQQRQLRLAEWCQSSAITWERPTSLPSSSARASLLTRAANVVMCCSCGTSCSWSCIRLPAFTVKEENTHTQCNLCSFHPKLWTEDEFLYCSNRRGARALCCNIKPPRRQAGVHFSNGGYQKVPAALLE